jgi:hypothetical protein
LPDVFFKPNIPILVNFGLRLENVDIFYINLEYFAGIRDIL